MTGLEQVHERPEKVEEKRRRRPHQRASTARLNEVGGVFEACWGGGGPSVTLAEVGAIVFSELAP